MAGYKLNYGAKDYAEFQEKPNADSLNGTAGTNTPGAQQNQRQNARNAKPASDAYERFSTTPLTWSPPPTAAKPVPKQPLPLQQPQGATQLASVLSGKAMPPLQQTAPSRPQEQTGGAQPGSLPPPPFPMGAIPPLPGVAQPAGLASALQGGSAAGTPPPSAPMNPGSPSAPLNHGSPSMPMNPGTPPAQGPSFPSAPMNPGTPPPPPQPSQGTYTPPPVTTMPVPGTPTYSAQSNALAGVLAGGAMPEVDVQPTAQSARAQTPLPNWYTKPEVEIQPSSALGVSAQSAGVPPDGGTPGPINQLPPETIPAPQPGPTVPPPEPSPQPPPGTSSPTQPGGTQTVPGARARPVAPVTPQNDWLHADANGMPWDGMNRPPHPASNDPASIAKWYAQHNWLDPTLVQVTQQDVEAYWTSGYQATPEVLAQTPEGNNFIAWWQNGKSTPAQTPPAATTPPPTTAAPPEGHAWNPTAAVPWDQAQAEYANRRDPNQDFASWYKQQYPNALPPTAPTTTPMPAEPPAAATPASASPSPGATPTPTTTTTPDPWDPTVTGGKTPADIASVVRGMYNPQFRQEQGELARVLRAQGAITGATDSGGFNEAMARGESNLINSQGVRLASHVESALDRAQQMAIAEIEDATQRYGIKTNADLQRWLNSSDSDTLTKYGIDKNDLLQKYLGGLGIDKAKIDANASISAAQLHAAAAQASASAGAAASYAGIASQEKMFGMSNTLAWAQLQAGLYQSDQANQLTAIGYLINAGITPELAAQIAASFGPKPPEWVNP